MPQLSLLGVEHYVRRLLADHAWRDRFRIWTEIAGPIAPKQLRIVVEQLVADGVLEKREHDGREEYRVPEPAAAPAQLELAEATP